MHATRNRPWARLAILSAAALALGCGGATSGKSPGGPDAGAGRDGGTASGGAGGTVSGDAGGAGGTSADAATADAATGDAADAATGDAVAAATGDAADAVMGDAVEAATGDAADAATGDAVAAATGDAADAATGGTDGSAIPIPAGFTRADIGAYKLGGPIGPTAGTSTVDGPAGGCVQLVGVVRDFKGSNEVGGHPDFESCAGADVTRGLLANSLGFDRKPVYASQCEMPAQTAACPYGQQTTSKAAFDEWYRTADGVNMAYQISFILEPNANATAFAASQFFPLDGTGFGDGPNNHNFAFTTELHLKFIYRGGETFTYTGDDDLWVFVNQKLALDLGGLHPQVTGTIDLDVSAATLGITRGQTYDLELFHAERHTTSSHFRIDTNLVFVTCGTIIP